MHISRISFPKKFPVSCFQGQQLSTYLSPDGVQSHKSLPVPNYLCVSAHLESTCAVSAFQYLTTYKMNTTFWSHSYLSVFVKSIQSPIFVLQLFIELNSIEGENRYSGGTCSSNRSLKGVLKAKNFPPTRPEDFRGHFSQPGGTGPGPMTFLLQLRTGVCKIRSSKT